MFEETSAQREPLDVNQLLIAEFNYIAQTAFQTNEDRSRVTVFYLSAVGGLVVAILGAQNQSPTVPGIHWAFVALFVVLSLSGILTLLQLVRLRLAWFESVRALNRIKEYYRVQGNNPGLALALEWRSGTLPPHFKVGSISFLYALQVTLLGGLMTGAAVMFAGFAYGAWWWGAAILIGGVTGVGQLGLYWFLLRRAARPG